jgi:hypothetical protein
LRAGDAILAIANFVSIRFQFCRRGAFRRGRPKLHASRVRSPE